ncbi:MAG: formylglycine-generating enzyme family protein [Desulforhopalus sp.]
MSPSTINKEQFLSNLDRALKKVVCERLHRKADAETKERLAVDIEDFITSNVSQYSLEELVDTFLSAEVAIGLFYEYQDAKRLSRGEKERAVPSGWDARSKNSGGQKTDHFESESKNVWREPLTGMEFIWVPGGSFNMGAGPWDDQGAVDELPVHEVYLDGFWIAKFPVTVEQYALFSAEHDEHRPEWWNPENPSRPIAAAPLPYQENAATVCGPDFPVTGVSWHDGVAYARWLSEKGGCTLQLPSEAQWEYAARSCGLTEKYAGGLAVEEVGWFHINSGGHAHTVGMKAPNGIGIYDMCGNVTEWCLDMYRRDGYELHSKSNPVILSGAGTRVVRGGSFRYGAKDLRCADRGHYVPGNREFDLGLRLVRVM